MRRISVSKPYLPPIEEYEAYLRQIWENEYLTNQGPLLQEFEDRTKEYLHTANFQLVTNGTLALQIALRALDITEGEVITTPFTYVATTSAILWERLVPVFVDIEPEAFCIDSAKIEAAITPKTKAILAVHVFGLPCNTEKIEAIAQKHGLKVIYDAAHSFGVRYMGKSMLSYGDISICSFHATKLFHTIEGGCLVAKDAVTAKKIASMKCFGYDGDQHRMVGLNAKASEFQAAMGLCCLDKIDSLINERKQLSSLYDKLLGGLLKTPRLPKGTEYNYAYYPVVFNSEADMLSAKSRLEQNNVYARRYFYPSLNSLPYIQKASPCPIAEDIASRILCLPLYNGLSDETVEMICRVLAV